MSEPVENRDVAAGMLSASQGLLQSLDASQRERILFTLDDEERENWHYVPRPRLGLPLKELDPAQQRLAHLLLDSGLSTDGQEKARGIIGLEPVLRELGRDDPRSFRRDPGLY